jgi:hypothetical protein
VATIALPAIIFWVLLLPSAVILTVPAPEDAIPFGCHALERYNLQFWRDAHRIIGIELPLPGYGAHAIAGIRQIVKLAKNPASLQNPLELYQSSSLARMARPPKGDA